METAGVDTQVLKPHSTRAAATSKAKAACVPVHDIPQIAEWPSSKCFDVFYNKPVELSNFASAILHNDQIIDKRNSPSLDITCRSLAALPV